MSSWSHLCVVALVAVAACANDRAVPRCEDCGTGVHKIGILDPRSENFHGKELERRNWDFALCRSCHGANFEGKAQAPSCLSCHRNGPTACDTCHGYPPTTGAHTVHVVSQQLACTECHTVPATWDAPGHILTADGVAIPPPAQVTFGALANHDVVPPRRTTPAAYDPTTHRCSSVYCHGAVLGDPASSNTEPEWTAGATAGACGTCHGRPPTSHAQNECVVCHSKTVATDGTLSSHHVDGVIDVGDGSGTCTGCHGSGTQPAPPRGLHGEQFTTSLAVGAHRAHLEASHLRGPIACSECHPVPTAVGDPGHIDSTLPADVVFGTFAKTDGATPVWDRNAATCSNVYCHGGGTHLLAEPSAGKLAAPIWTANTGSSIYCGACHGIPPTDAFHQPTLQLTDCITCHPSVDAFGNIVLTGGPGALTSEHMNGVVDFH